MLQLSEAQHGGNQRPDSGGRVDNPGVRRILTGLNGAPLSQLVRRLQHLHQKRVDGRVTNQFEEEQMLQALKADGAQCWESEEELCKPGQRRNRLEILKTELIEQ